MSASLQVILAPEQLAELADMIAAKMGEARFSKTAPLTVKEAAQALGVGTDSIRSRIKAGIIRTVPDIGITRVPRSEIDRLLNSHPNE
jgi:excisionase family DNA binding protein